MSAINAKRKAAADFAAEVLAPVSFIPEKTAEYTYEAVDKIAEKGFLKISDLREAAAVVEEFARHNASMAEVVAVSSVTASISSAYGMEIEGMTGYAVYEYGMSCGGVTAVNKDGNYTITGKKIAVALGGAASQYIVLAALGDKLAAFMVKSSDVTTEKFDKLGLRSYPTADIIMEAAPAVLITAEGEKLRTEITAKIDILNCFVAAGLVAACEKASVDYAKTRVQFDMPIANQSAVRYMLAEIAIAKYNIIAVGEKALNCAADGKSYILEVCAAKKLAENAVYVAANNALQVHGGTGYMRDCPVERYYREAKTIFTYTERSEYPEEPIIEDLLK